MQCTENIVTDFKMHLYVDVYRCTIVKCVRRLNIINKFPTEKLLELCGTVMF